jgi:hypothetical protein
VIKSIAAETLRDVATSYDTLAFFTNRSAIDDAIQARLAHRLATEAHANLTAFNLLGIDLPDAFEAAVLAKLIAAQDVLTLQRLRDSQLIRQAVSVVDARGAANITTLEAAARATGLAISRQVDARLFQEYAATRAEELAAVATSLGFASPSQLLRYVWLDVVRRGGAPGDAGGRLAVNVPAVLTSL